jgi:pimeloyl-ACP methyl ester carboxylesterase
MNLEVLERRSGEGPSPYPPLLFVHGYWQAAWCWDEFLMPELATRGLDCFAVSLTGHGGSDGKIRGRSIRDHVADVYSVVARFDTPPIVIGHSMGAYVAQHYAAMRHPATGLVLVSPVPSSGAWRATWRVASRHPGKFAKANLTLDIGAVVEDPDHAYEWLFSPSFPRAKADGFASRWERASYRTYWGMLFGRPDVSRIETPTILVGGDHDGLFSLAEWEAGAVKLGTTPIIIEDAGHELMLEPSWTELAGHIERFAKAFDLPESPSSGRLTPPRSHERPL